MKCVISVKEVILEDEVQHETIPSGQVFHVFSVMKDCVVLLSGNKEKTYVVDLDSFERCFDALGESDTVQANGAGDSDPAE